jgi:hypothetical protein
VAAIKKITRFYNVHYSGPARQSRNMRSSIAFVSGPRRTHLVALLTAADNRHEAASCWNQSSGRLICFREMSFVRHAPTRMSPCREHGSYQQLVLLEAR